MASQIVRWEPLSGAFTLRDAMDRLFEDSFVWPRYALNRDVNGRTGLLPLDMYETPEEFVVNMAIPGVKIDDVNVNFQDGRLIVDVNIPAQKAENVIYHYRELGNGQYQREISLPVAIDTEKVDAVLQNGYLTLHLPKAEEVKPKKIQVKIK
jgi:HSP20 family protein